MLLEVDKRLSARITRKSFIKLLRSNTQVEVLNISETGVCFECEGVALSGNVLLSMDLSPFKSEQLTEISARVIHQSRVAKNRIQYGAQFSLSNGNHLAQIRGFIFDNFAKEASVGIDNEDLKIKVRDFFNKDVKQYHEDLVALVQEIRKGKIKSEEIEKSLTLLTDEILLKGNALAKVIDNKIYMKEIKQLFRDVIGCWSYKSPILKMAYDRPRGYPGDYKLFETIYDKKPLAENKSLGFYWDNYFLNNAYAQAARARKNKMKNILQDLIENTDLETVKLLNVACGPSREIRELLSDPYLSSRKKIIFTGLDNDEEALKFSQSKLNNLSPNIQLRLLNENWPFAHFNYAALFNSQ